MKIKTNELIGDALDWAVAKCELALHGGWPDDAIMLGEETDYSSSWAVGGPIIEGECIEVSCIHTTGWTPNSWDARHPQRHYAKGPTPLVAAMRCYVASKFGDEIDVPKEIAQ